MTGYGVMKKHLSINSWVNKFGTLIALVVVYLFFVLIGPEGFFSIGNLELIARQTSIVGIAALGMTLVIILGGIDLSVGSVVALSTVTIAAVLQHFGNQALLSNPTMELYDVRVGALSALLAMLLGVAIAAGAGFLNGLVITRLRVVPFIVTLGTLLFVRGAAKGMANEQKVDAPASWLSELLTSQRGDDVWLLLPPGVWVLVILSILVAGMLRYTKLGRHIFAIGSNEKTARLCGVAVERVKLIVYTLGGAFAGLAGVMQFSRLNVGDPTVAVGLELDVIAAVVIGGGSLSGGEGSVMGTIAGALIMTVIRTGCSQMGLSNWIQEMVTGAIIVLAVILDRIRHRSAA